LLAPCVCAARELRIGVFGLFHPERLVISALPAQTVIVTAGTQQIVVSDGGGAFLYLEGNQVRVRFNDESLVASEVDVADRMGRATDFLISIPGKITRRFRGKLAVKCQIDELEAVVEMDLETAVASAVAAESVPGLLSRL